MQINDGPSSGTGKAMPEPDPALADRSEGRPGIHMQRAAAGQPVLPSELGRKSQGLKVFRQAPLEGIEGSGIHASAGSMPVVADTSHYGTGPNLGNKKVSVTTIIFTIMPRPAPDLATPLV
jgi:hypothetical protein